VLRPTSIETRLASFSSLQGNEHPRFHKKPGTVGGGLQVKVVKGNDGIGTSPTTHFRTFQFKSWPQNAQNAQDNFHLALLAPFGGYNFA
jgi:hypothetical protein